MLRKIILLLIFLSWTLEKLLNGFLLHFSDLTSFCSNINGHFTMDVIFTDFSLRILRDDGTRVILIISSSYLHPWSLQQRTLNLRFVNVIGILIILMTPLITFFLADGKQTFLFLVNRGKNLKQDLSFDKKALKWERSLRGEGIREWYEDEESSYMSEINNQVYLCFSPINDVFTFTSSGIFSAGRASNSDEHTRETNWNQDFSLTISYWKRFLWVKGPDWS